MRLALVTLGLLLLPACAMSSDIKELGWSVDKRLTVVEREVVKLQSDAATKVEVEERIDNAREHYEHDVDAIGKKVEDRVNMVAGGVAQAIGLPEAIGIAIASMIMTWLGRDWTRKKQLAKVVGGK